MKYLVVGTGRCGTGYMSKILSSSGILCGHESIFKPFYIDYKKMKKYEAESSWLAVPYLDKFNFKLIHIVRNPLKVFRSWLFDLNTPLSFNSKSTSLHSKFLLQYYPNIQKQATQVDRIIVYYLECNELIEISKNETFFFKVEDKPDKLARFLNLTEINEYKKFQKYNTRDTGKASENEIITLLKKSKLYSKIEEKIIKYYPELESSLK